MAQNENLVFGVNPVLEKIHASSADILEILISDDSDRAVLRRIGQEAARLGLRVVTVQRKVLDRLVEGQRHQGVVAKVDAYGYLPFEVLLQEISATTDLRWILILDGLTDPRNFGALLRSAERLLFGSRRALDKDAPFAEPVAMPEPALSVCSSGSVVGSRP